MTEPTEPTRKEKSFACLVLAAIVLAGLGLFVVFARAIGWPGNVALPILLLAALLMLAVRRR